MGGEETSPDKWRTSRDIRRKDGSRATSFEKQDYMAILMPEVRYSLISPLMPPMLAHTSHRHDLVGLVVDASLVSFVP